MSHSFEEPHSKPSSEQPAGAEDAPRSDLEVGNGQIPNWFVLVVFAALFWAGAYLFSYSGGFSFGVFDYEPKFGVIAGGSQAAPDPKVVGKALFSANCITCHQANGQGAPGQFPPLAGSDFVLSNATNRLIAIVLKGLQGQVQVKGAQFNNAMQAWEAQYTDIQLASILTYVRSDWGNNGPPVTADMVKHMRAELKDRKEQWTVPELMKIAADDLSKIGGAPPGPAAQPSASPGTQSNPPAPTPAK
jgi:mono/diheme cytochrome c family protein